MACYGSHLTSLVYGSCCWLPLKNLKTSLPSFTVSQNKNFGEVVGSYIYWMTDARWRQADVGPGPPRCSMEDDTSLLPSLPFLIHRGLCIDLSCIFIHCTLFILFFPLWLSSSEGAVLAANLFRYISFLMHWFPEQLLRYIYNSCFWGDGVVYPGSPEMFKLFTLVYDVYVLISVYISLIKSICLVGSLSASAAPTLFLYILPSVVLSSVELSFVNGLEKFLDGSYSVLTRRACLIQSVTPTLYIAGYYSLLNFQEPGQ